MSGDWRDAAPPARGKLLRDEPLGPFTWFRVGGPAELLFLPADPDDLRDFLHALPQEVPISVLGVGFLHEPWPQGIAVWGALLVVAGILAFAWVVSRPPGAGGRAVPFDAHALRGDRGA